MSMKGLLKVKLLNGKRASVITCLPTNNLHHGYGLHTWGKDILVYYLKPAQLGEEYIGINTFIGEPL